MPSRRFNYYAADLLFFFLVGQTLPSAKWYFKLKINEVIPAITSVSLVCLYWTATSQTLMTLIGNVRTFLCDAR